MTGFAASCLPTTWIAPGSSTGIAERSLIEAIAAALRSPERSTRLLRGTGDDAAVARAGGALAVTSIDTMVEGVHFRLDPGWASPREVGRRALAGALSDLAAMAAAPGEAFVALGLPAGFAEEQALELVAGADELALGTGTAIAGGDVVAAPALTVTVAVTGWAEDPERIVSRAGARSGELVGVTGTLGAAAAALAVLQGRAGMEPTHPAAEACLQRARSPQPRLAEGAALAAAGASAMIDLSDGLASDAALLGRASGVELRVELERVPLAAGVAEVAAALGVEAQELAAAGGEDYELCFTAAPERREQVEAALPGPVRVSWIGAVTGGPAGATLLGRGGHVVRAEGFEHRW